MKLVLHALHTNELPFINGGEHVEWAPEVPIFVSLAVIVGTLAVTAVVSLISLQGISEEQLDPRTGPRREPHNPDEPGGASHDD